MFPLEAFVAPFLARKVAALKEVDSKTKIADCWAINSGDIYHTIKGARSDFAKSIRAKALKIWEDKDIPANFLENSKTWLQLIATLKIFPLSELEKMHRIVAFITLVVNKMVEVQQQNKENPAFQRKNVSKYSWKKLKKNNLIAEEYFKIMGYTDEES